jgi:hypothetical protein
VAVQQALPLPASVLPGDPLTSLSRIDHGAVTTD